MDPTLLSLVWTVATLYLEEPPLTLAEEMVQGDLNLPVPPGSDRRLTKGLEGLRAFAYARLGAGVGDVRRELCHEYAALFIGPQPRTVHPYESVYRDGLTIGDQTFRGLLMGESVDKVRAFWAEAGIHCVNPHNYPPDHVGLELAFVAYMGQGFLESGEARSWDLARRFVQEHLLAWVPRFCADLHAVDAACFYRPVAQVTEGVLGVLAEELGVEKN